MKEKEIKMEVNKIYNETERLKEKYEKKIIIYKIYF